MPSRGGFRGHLHMLRWLGTYQAIGITVATLGAVIVVIAVGADALGYGGSSGFGRSQLIGAVVGAATLAIGTFRATRRNAPISKTTWITLLTFVALAYIVLSIWSIFSLFADRAIIDKTTIAGITFSVPGPTPLPLFNTRLERVFPNLTFGPQTNLVQPDDGLNLIFISELAGRILVFENDQDTKESHVFLDLTDRIYLGPEHGLLGLVFDPAYKSNGHFYVYYAATDPERYMLSRFSITANDPMLANRDSELVLMEIPDVSGHDGGQLAFGPDGYLYLSVGDGSHGKRSDPESANGQDRSTLRGSLLRIDVSGGSDGREYRIPPDNPFVGVLDVRPEIWAYGFRNPWRFSFDRETGSLWLGDVGSSKREEIDLIQKGRNYGWNIMEGTICYEPNGCDEDNLESPLVELDEESDQYCAVIGGYVFRGRGIPPLVGAYLYADFCTGTIYAIWYHGDSDPYQQRLFDTDFLVTSFGQDLAGNLYILSRAPGGVSRIVSKPSTDQP